MKSKCRTATQVPAWIRAPRSKKARIKPSGSVALPEGDQTGVEQVKEL